VSYSGPLPPTPRVGQPASPVCQGRRIPERQGAPMPSCGCSPRWLVEKDAITLSPHHQHSSVGSSVAVCRGDRCTSCRCRSGACRVVHLRAGEIGTAGPVPPSTPAHRAEASPLMVWGGFNCPVSLQVPVAGLYTRARREGCRCRPHTSTGRWQQRSQCGAAGVFMCRFVQDPCGRTPPPAMWAGCSPTPPGTSTGRRQGVAVVYSDRCTGCRCRSGYCDRIIHLDA